MPLSTPEHTLATCPKQWGHLVEVRGREFVVEHVAAIEAARQLGFGSAGAEVVHFVIPPGSCEPLGEFREPAGLAFRVSSRSPARDRNKGPWCSLPTAFGRTTLARAFDLERVDEIGSGCDKRRLPGRKRPALTLSHAELLSTYRNSIQIGHKNETISVTVQDSTPTVSEDTAKVQEVVHKTARTVSEDTTPANSPDSGTPSDTESK